MFDKLLRVTNNQKHLLKLFANVVFVICSPLLSLPHKFGHKL